MTTKRHLLYHFNCPCCGSEQIYWQSDEPLTDDDDNETALSHLYHCNNCGCDTLIYEPLTDERESDYKEFWESVSV